MSVPTASSALPLALDSQLELARDVIRQEARALLQLAARVDDRLQHAIELLLARQGGVVVCGMGKAGLVGRKISATLSSTGTRSHFLHPADALHGDLGRVAPDSAALLLSASGETAEVVALLAPLRQMRVPIVAVTCRASSTLAEAANVVLDLGPLEEACGLGLAPTTSTTAMLALGDALALTLSRRRGFTADDFARYHPGGSLGRRLARVDDLMRPLAECRLARHSESVREVLVRLSRPGRRSGAIMVTTDDGALAGIFTDSDLARILERRRENVLDGPLSAVMTSQPQAVTAGAPMSAAIEILAGRKISELPVVDDSLRPVGMLDITDVVGLLPLADDAPGRLPSRHDRNSARGEPSPATVPFRTKT
jgi:arabinose-5-phosphate isomerase